MYCVPTQPQSSHVLRKQRQQVMRSPAVLYSYHESTLVLSHCFPDQLGHTVTVYSTPLLPVWLYTWWYSSHQSLVTEWEVWNVRSFGCLMPVWYFPRKPITDSSLSRWWKWGGGQQHEPQMVSLPSCCLSNIPCPTAQPACANYLSLEYAFMPICCWRGAACWQILAWKLHALMSQYLF